MQQIKQQNPRSAAEKYLYTLYFPKKHCKKITDLVQKLEGWRNRLFQEERHFSWPNIRSSLNTYLLVKFQSLHSLHNCKLRKMDSWVQLMRGLEHPHFQRHLSPLLNCGLKLTFWYSLQFDSPSGWLVKISSNVHLTRNSCGKVGKIRFLGL